MRLLFTIPVISALICVILSSTPAVAQSPFAPGLSIGSGSSGAPMAIWQRIDTKGAVTGSASLAPAEPGYAASLAGSRAIGHGNWMLDGALDMASAAQLSSRSGHIGLTYTFPGANPCLLQATVAAGFAGGNSEMLESGLWPEPGGSQSLLSAGLRWAVSPLAIFHVSASRSSAGLPLSEQEVGMNSALTPTLALSLGFHTQQQVGEGTLASAAVRWLPRAESPFAIGLEEDIAHGFWYKPFFDSPSLNGGMAAPALGRYSGNSTLAIIDAPVAASLTLRLGASLDFRGHSSVDNPLGPTFTASLVHGM